MVLRRGGRRDGAGRPAELEEPKTLAFRVDRRIAEAAEQVASKRGLTLSEWLRELVTAATRKKKREPRNVRLRGTFG